MVGRLFTKSMQLKHSNKQGRMSDEPHGEAFCTNPGRIRISIKHNI